MRQPAVAVASTVAYPTMFIMYKKKEENGRITKRQFFLIPLVGALDISSMAHCPGYKLCQVKKEHMKKKKEPSAFFILLSFPYNPECIPSLEPSENAKKIWPNTWSRKLYVIVEEKKKR